ncbi:WAT1-related protein At3g30340-like isoform X1 [Primulina eburnea]|uniref:WAT1-related protein At3g30340-like isoform X1 n=1 Tax=Primulina eburnea TaxID=1245227 RepID=UPI003C6BF3C1
MNCIESWKPVAAMVAVEFALAVLNILFKKAMDGGMNHGIIVVYRQSISTIFLTPFAYIWERSSWSKLNIWLLGQIFLCALFGMTLTQYLFLVGLDYTSATFMCAFINMVPVFTFVLALPLGMESVKMNSKSGKAKLFGTVTCIVGVLILALYRGIPLIYSASNAAKKRQKPRNWGVGSAFLCAGGLAWSSWFLIQARIGQNYSHRYSSTSIMSFFSAVQSVVLCFFTIDRKNIISVWILRGELQILSVVYAGVVASGVCYVVMSCCVKQKGPVFTSAFTPLIQIFAAIFDVAILHEEIYLGSIVGSLVVVVGMYGLLWGKSRDQETPSIDKNAANQEPRN